MTGRAGVDQVEDGQARDEPPPREPAVRAPWPVLSLAAVLVGLYLLQSTAVDPDAAAMRYGFAPAELEEGRWAGLVTALFVHGNWTHVLLNALATLAFGAPVARLFGKGPAAALAFLAFFLVCGVAGSLGFAAAHPGAHALLVGASGGAAGLMGAASRLIDRRNRLAPFASRTVIGMAGSWLIVNLLIALVGLEAVSGGAPIAWEAHLAGYAAGLLLVGPTARLMRGALTKL
jgi:membrane associated rhomboid family serine protease